MKHRSATQPRSQATGIPLGGLQKSSLIDYPGKVSCVLFLSGCNFDCPYCHNPELARGCARCPAFLKDDGLYTFLEKRKRFLDGVVISGGEPTIHADLLPLCRRIKEMGYPVKLDTNGSRPRVLQQLFDEGVVDYVAMDIKTDPFAYAPTICSLCDPTPILASIHMIMERAPAYEFRTTCIRSLIDEQIVINIARIISGADLYALQHFEGDRVLHPEYFTKPGCRFDPSELSRFRDIASPYVRRCVIR
jgi:pyruvate formate lyase activating enzyme